MFICVRTGEIIMASPLKAHFFLYLALICLIILPTTTVASALPGCPDKCGNIIIPYPFGTLDGCYRDGFSLTCNDSFNPPKAILGKNIEVINISITDGEARVYKHVGFHCYNKRNTISSNFSAPIDLGRSPYYFSHRRNKFTAVGCYMLAYIVTPPSQSDRKQPYFSGCVSFCRSIYETTGDGGLCNGLGCCQTSIPAGLTNYEVRWGFHQNPAWDFNPCNYAVLVEEDWYKFQVQDLSGVKFFYNRTDEGRVPIVLDWAIRDNGTCLDTDMEKKPHSACLSENSRCYNTTNGEGYICNCTQGYEGNPYLPNGCTDINECKNQPCKDGNCKNILGSYECHCPKDKKGDGKIERCTEKFPYFARVAMSCILGIAILLGVSFLLVWYQQHKRHMKEKKEYNTYYHVMKNHLRVFSEKEIENATHNYSDDFVLGMGVQGNVYKGFLENNQVVAIKKAKEVQETQRKEFLNEIILLAQINHKNIVRLLGCCFEVKIPMLVSEFVPNGTLFQLLHRKRGSISLDTRLRIALDSAMALDHLHAYISRSIIHGDVKSSNILLDADYTAKVSDFGASSVVPINEIVELVHFSHGYLDPECILTHRITKKSDVYSFGVVMLELLTRKEAVYIDRKGEMLPLATSFLWKASKNEHHEMLDVELVSNDENVMVVLEGICEIALQCLNPKGEDRPTMKLVVEELMKLVTLHNSSPGQKIGQEEMENLSETKFPSMLVASGFNSTQYSTVLEISTRVPR